MKLSNLLKGIKAKFTDCEINKIEIDSRQVENGDLFVCLRGRDFDGHDYIQEALSKGANCVLVEKNVGFTHTVRVKNTRKALAIIAANLYSNPRRNFRLIGVTGTNGKTTTTHIIKNILECANKKVGLIGTLGAYIGDRHITSHLTTPDPLELQSLFSVMATENVDVVVMEVSAHALALYKLWGIVFDVGVITNITQDHLDFFGTMEKYTKTKLSFISDRYCKIGIINSDDERICRPLQCSKVVSFGIANPADNFATNIHYSSNGTSYFLNINDNLLCINTPLCGRFNVENALAAASACFSLGVDCESIKNGINTIARVAGRFDVIRLKNGASVVIDYAHTPDGLEKILKNVRSISCGKLWCVFGCGGNRDKTKRPIMGSIASTLADFVVVTSDNPRYENPDVIIREVVSGIKKTNYVCIVDRKVAIKYVVERLNTGDIAVIAGKGAENYLEINGEKLAYSDYKTVEELNKILDEARLCISG